MVVTNTAVVHCYKASNLCVSSLVPGHLCMSLGTGLVGDSLITLTITMWYSWCLPSCGNSSSSSIAVSVREAVQAVSSVPYYNGMWEIVFLCGYQSEVDTPVSLVDSHLVVRLLPLSLYMAGYAATGCSCCHCMTWMVVMMTLMRRTKRGKGRIERQESPCSR